MQKQWFCAMLEYSDNDIIRDIFLKNNFGTLKINKTSWLIFRFFTIPYNAENSTL